MKFSLRKLALVLAMLSAGPAAMAAAGDKNGYLIDSSKEVVRSGFGLCWHTGFWTPADAIEGCDGAIAKSEKSAAAGAAGAAPAGAKSGSASSSSSSAASAAAPAPAPAASAAAPAAVPAPVAVEPKAEKVSFSADAFFDFDKSVLKPEGKAKLEDLVSKLQGTDIEVIVATGHTDWTGTDAYNMKLSMRRAKAVKAFLVAKGIPEARVFTEGKGERSPVADNHTREGRAKNRRVEVEVVGTRTK